MKTKTIAMQALLGFAAVLTFAAPQTAHASEARITYIQHDGFIIEADSLTFYVDMIIMPDTSYPAPDAIFITHNHQDHFSIATVVSLANSSGACVVGPHPVIAALTGILPPNQLIKYDLATGAKMTGSLLGVDLTIYGSYDGTKQNSYRFRFPSGVVIFLNGDMHESLFSTFVNSGGCHELTHMHIAMLDTWAYNLSDFFTQYHPDVMIEMHKNTAPCVVYTHYPTSFGLPKDSTYIFSYAASTDPVKAAMESVVVYPNPSRDHVNIRFSNPGNQQHRIVVYNALGQMVQETGRITGGHVTIETGHLDTGLYHFLLHSGSGAAGRGTFLVE